jgi:hypothetical protein
MVKTTFFLFLSLGWEKSATIMDDDCAAASWGRGTSPFRMSITRLYRGAEMCIRDEAVPTVRRSPSSSHHPPFVLLRRRNLSGTSRSPQMQGSSSATTTGWCRSRRAPFQSRCAPSKCWRIESAPAPRIQLPSATHTGEQRAISHKSRRSLLPASW